MANEENLIPFVPGQSGNPKGKPKGARSLTTILRELLETEVEAEVEGQKTRITFQESIIRKLLQKANKGEIKAITEILDRVEGKAKQELTMNVEQTRKEISDLFPLDETDNKS